MRTHWHPGKYLSVLCEAMSKCRNEGELVKHVQIVLKQISGKIGVLESRRELLRDLLCCGVQIPTHEVRAVLVAIVHDLRDHRRLPKASADLQQYKDSSR